MNRAGASRYFAGVLGLLFMAASVLAGEKPEVPIPARNETHPQSQQLTGLGNDVGDTMLPADRSDRQSNPGGAGGPLPQSPTTRYVKAYNPTAAHPYMDWTTAASTIQDAIDAANDSDTIVVGDGEYNTGGKTVPGCSLTNRVVIDKAITVQSLNGPNVTIIRGADDLGLGPRAVRCVYIRTNATLIGFTLTYGHTFSEGPNRAECSGGGIYAESSAWIQDCIIIGNRASLFGGGACGTLPGILSLQGCVLSENHIVRSGGEWPDNLGGGGAAFCSLWNCQVLNNSALVLWGEGGGCRECIVSNSVMAGNQSSSGGGSYGGIISFSSLVSNKASSGGGAYDGELSDCILYDNEATYYGGGYALVPDGGPLPDRKLRRCKLRNNKAERGGGALGGQLENCILILNQASDSGGGAEDSLLKYCTIVGNSATNSGGGISGRWDSRAYNSIIYHNAAPEDSNYNYSLLQDCCSTPTNESFYVMTNDPGIDMTLIGGDIDCRLSSSSPCIDQAVCNTITNDFNGIPRPQGASCDYGAHEYIRERAADLVVAKTVSDPAPARLDVITYTLAVSNVGPDNAGLVTVSDLLPAGVRYVSHSGGAYTPSNGLWDIGALDAGATANLSIQARLLSERFVRNPFPAANDYFGMEIAALRSNMFAAGAPGFDGATTDVGRVYLFDPDGVRLATIASPVPNADDQFGRRLASCGPDRLAISAPNNDRGAFNAGCVYVFNTNGDLLITITNPVPSAGDLFGLALDCAGTNLIGVGAIYDDTGAANAGSVCLFDGSGNLLTTITNPTPAAQDEFGVVLAFLGTDRVAISAWRDNTGASRAGSVYIFQTNGTLLATITNPTPASSEYFGSALAPLGPDRLIIGAYADGAGAHATGCAHIYQADGTRLITITNPAPENNDGFGYAVAEVDSNQILIAAFADNQGANDAGCAYLFNTNGTRLATITNPAPASGDYFGYDVAVLSAGRFTVGAYSDDDGAANAGGVFLFDLPPAGASIRNTAVLGSSTPVDVDTANNTGTVTIVVANEKQAQFIEFPPIPDQVMGQTIGLWAKASSDLIVDFEVVQGAGIATLSGGTNLTFTGAGLVSVVASQAGNAIWLPAPKMTNTFMVRSTKQVDLAVTKSVDEHLPAPLDVITYTLAVSNAGPDAASSATVMDLLPPGLQYLSHSNGAYTPDPGAWDIGLLPAGAATTLTIRAQVAPPADYSVRFIPNPFPAINDYFGLEVAALRSNVFAASATGFDGATTDVGRAYLFNSDGVRLSTIASPVPDANDQFGRRLAACGTDRLVVSAPNNDCGAVNAGCVYIFNTNGGLLITITNPVPSADDRFGLALDCAGTNLIGVGTMFDDTGAEDAGCAYLFDGSGTLLTTITNPTPEVLDEFGGDENRDEFGGVLAFLGTDRVAISAWKDDTGASGAGSVYIYQTNGTLLTTITNPTPADSDYFGSAVAPLGADRLIISAYADGAGAHATGCAYIYQADGTRLATITNPAPQNNDGFGYAVAEVDSNQVLIAAFGDNQGANDAGCAYLYDTNGTLLATITNPAPVAGDYFGYDLAVLSADRIVIGAYNDDEGAANAGGVYCYDRNTAGATIWNTAVLAASIPDDTHAGNNTGRTAVVVAGGGQAQIDLALTKSVDQPNPAPLDMVTYTLTVSNRGSATALSATVTDLLPADVRYVSHNGGTYNPANGEWSLGRVDAGTSTSLEIRAQAPAVSRLRSFIHNPAPAPIAYFGNAATFIGSNILAIGAYRDDTGAEDAGAVYLFDPNGARMATITNPAPAAYDVFGYALAGLGTNRIIVGAHYDNTAVADAGCAYLHDAAGLHLATFTNPTPVAWDRFGYAVAGLGTDQVVIGAYTDDAGATDSGSVYVFDTNGFLWTTITNPTPALADFFGVAVAGLGSNRIVIGAMKDDTGAADAGCVYLYDASGARLCVITNPAPATEDYFGSAVSTLGDDRILVGAHYDDQGAVNAGSVYMFDTNGILLATISNPTPGRDDFFGAPIVALGNDQVAIGAYLDDAGGWDSGSVFVFDTQGTLLTTIVNPNPSYDDRFGSALAAAGAQLAVGALLEDADGSEAGAAYLYDIGPFGRTIENTATLASSDPADLYPFNNTGTVSFAQGTEKQHQFIQFPEIEDQAETAILQLSAQASSSLPVEFRIASGPAQMLNETTVIFTHIGLVSVVACQTGNATWYPAPEITNTFRVKRAQTILFPPIGDQVITSRVGLAATASSTLPVRYDVWGPAYISEETNLNFQGIGEVTIYASQEGNDEWYQAEMQYQTIQVASALAQVWLTNLDHEYDGTPKAAEAVCDPPWLQPYVVITYSGLPDAPTNAGSYSVVATIDSPFYTGEALGTLIIRQAHQIVYFPAPPNPFVHTSIELSATASSSLTDFIFAVQEGPARIGSRPDLLELTGLGKVIVSAVQPGDGNWLQSSAEMAFTVLPEPKTIRYVRAGNPMAAHPFADWASAAATIQDAIEAANDGDVVVVSNGIYNTGGKTVAGCNLTNRVVIDKAITVQSLNGPNVTIIRGADDLGLGPRAVRCVYIRTNATLIGFTLTYGHTFAGGPNRAECSGGGIYAESSAWIQDCIITGNRASLFGGGACGTLPGILSLQGCVLSENNIIGQGVWPDNPGGGGAAFCSLWNCQVLNNSAMFLWTQGGGCSACIVSNCVLAGNQAYFGGGSYGGIISFSSLVSNKASSGGGAYDGELSDCILYDNEATYYGGGYALVPDGGPLPDRKLRRCKLRNNKAERGGGALGGQLENCILILNQASDSGGGAEDSLLKYCTIVGNSATNSGGGISGRGYSRAYNSIIYHNAAPEGSNYFQSYLMDCCSTPTNEPYVMTDNPGIDMTIIGGEINCRLSGLSPCINQAVCNTITNDFDGIPRPQGASCDYGAYEYFDRLSTLDSDHDGVPDVEEYIAGTDPNNPDSMLEISTVMSGGDLTSIALGCFPDRLYSLEFTTNIASGVWEVVPGMIDIPGDADFILRFHDLDPVPHAAYRVRVRLP